MPITEFLENNAKLYGFETCLVEINPELEGRKNNNKSDRSHVVL